MTRLTVALPVYNGMPYLVPAVESILSQTLQDFRFLIIDDGSIDGSADYLDSLDDPRVTVIHQENRGLGATLNRAIELCDTEYLARMDADDVSHPDRLERQLLHMESHPDIGLLGSQIEFVVGERRFPGPRKPLRHSAIGDLLIRGVYAICHPSIIMRTSVARAVGGYRIAGAGQDLDFFLRMHEAARVGNMDDCLHMMRLHASSINWKQQGAVQMGRAYAIECAARRRRSASEPSLFEFRREWEHRPLLRKLRDSVDGWSTVQYRKAIIEMGQGPKLQGICRLALSACCRPAAVWRRIALAFRRSCDDQSTSWWGKGQC